MAELFTDGTDVDFGSTPETVPGSLLEPEPTVAPTTAPVPTSTPLPVLDQQNTVADQIESSGSSATDTGEEISEGVVQVLPVDTVDWEKYLDQFIQQHETQNELLESLIQENQKLDQELKNIQNAMPAVLCMLGVIIGVLLMHIFASYIRP